MNALKVLIKSLMASVLAYKAPRGILPLGAGGGKTKVLGLPGISLTEKLPYLMRTLRGLYTGSEGP